MKNPKYQLNQKIIVFSEGKFIQHTIIQEPLFENGRYVYLVKEGKIIFSIGENEICDIKDLEILHDELESLILMEKSETLEKILKDCNIYSKLFQIENFLCDNA